MAALIESLAGEPPRGVDGLAWIAGAHERFRRIAPFARANGRVGRLLVNLLLRRFGYEIVAFSAGLGRRYRRALDRADSGEPWLLASVLAEAEIASLQRLSVAAGHAGLRPLARLVPPEQRAALQKAAQRSRLQTVRVGGRRLTSAAWIAEYFGSRSRAGAEKSEGPTRERVEPSDH
ncbi:MAG: hypothetical protein ACREM6_12945, partial [Vulcanimicrobiaceae bacterium]